MKSYTVLKAGEEWTDYKALSLVFLGIPHQQKDRGEIYQSYSNYKSGRILYKTHFN